MLKKLLERTIFVGLFLIPFIPFLVSGSLFFPFITTKAFAFRIIVEVIFAAWVVLALLEPEYRPRRSWVSLAILLFMFIIGLADLFGASPVTSFWSNYERMEGYIALLHLLAFFTVISSSFREIHWRRWWNTSLVAAVFIVFYSFLQLAGVKEIHQGGARVDATLGNASYLAVYLLIHIFIGLIYLWQHKKDKVLAWSYGLAVLSYTFILYHTATRGAILGLLGGLGIVALLNVRNKEDQKVRKFSIATISVLVCIVLGFFLLKNTQLVQGSPVLSRFASISTEELKSGGRSYVWPMAIQGIKERPILGWGQDNFSFVFNEHYSPHMYNLEPWFDRAHNIFLDWGIAGGLLGLLSYLSLYVGGLYLLWKSTKLSHIEKTLLTGLVVAYFFHNVFVFDQLVSYIFFFALLGYIHFNGLSGDKKHKQIDPVFVKNLVLPVTVVALVFVLYVVNIKPLTANTSLIHGLLNIQNGSNLDASADFEKAYNSSTLGRVEAMEQISTYVSQIASADFDVNKKAQFLQFFAETIVKEADARPQDARFNLIAGLFLDNVKEFNLAEKYLLAAQKAIPNKQQIYFQLGNVYLEKGDPAKALEQFRLASDLAPEYEQAKFVYLQGAIIVGDTQTEKGLIAELGEKEVVFNDEIVATYVNVGRKSAAIALMRRRIALDSANKERYEQIITQIENN